MRKTTKRVVSSAFAGAFVLALSAGAAQACEYGEKMVQTPMPSQEVADGSQTLIPTTKTEQGS